ncbi:DUF4838 domain-containing protein [Paenibacillus eucommiae]|uniref:SLH domain-containing protein n=1 Tax=Paenibacillus eucommiae TaxID=1355755 RepID=A0ABS4ILP9_9BACL|nr:DUF4838 domain-containing protein [Paenibacillus eucommiae]MBP1988494.1 hypothetical protein [Paenibacillus eucommiae]
MVSIRNRNSIFILFLTACLIFSTFGSTITTAFGAETSRNSDSSPISISAASPQFSDMEGHWAEKSLQEWAASGLIQGYPDGSFQPDRTVSRAEAIALVNRSFGFNDSAFITFSDLSDSDWAYEDVSKAVKAQYVEGYSNGTIGANLPISRQEAVVMINRLLELDTHEEDIDVNVFTDAKQIPQWSRGAVAAAAAQKIMTGYEDGSFRPGAFITRAELVSTLDRALKSNTSFTYKEKGIYGPAEGVRIINGDVTVAAAGVTLRNLKVTGSLLLAEGIKEGDAFLKNVTVLGTTTIRGGGTESIHLQDSSLTGIIIEKKDGTVRVVAEGSTLAQIVHVNSNAVLEESALTGQGFVKIVVSGAQLEGLKLTLKGTFEQADISSPQTAIDLVSGSVQLLQLFEGADGSTLHIGANTVIGKLVLDALLKASGQGTIQTATINDKGKGSTFEKQPGTVNGIGAPTSSSSVTVNGGSSPGTATPAPTPTSTPTPTPTPTLSPSPTPTSTPTPTPTLSPSPTPTDNNEDGLAIVQNGQANAMVVVMDEHANESLNPSPAWTYLTPAVLAQKLVTYIQKSTGVTLPIVTGEPAEYDGVKIYVGGSSAGERSQHQLVLQTLNEQGFIIDSQNDHITIDGNNLGGLEYGIYDFLERYVGISWLMPGPDGEDIPQHTTLVIPNDLVQDEPKTLSRYMYSTYTPSLREWQRVMRTDNNMMMHHNLYELFDPQVFADHPEYYVGGVVPTSLESWQPCFNDDTAQAAIARIVQYFNANPSHSSYSLAINDLGYEYCEAPTKKNSVGAWHMSDIYYPWVNKIVEGVLTQHPDKYFGVLAYREMYDPPMKEDGTPFKLNSHVVPFITDDRLTWLDPDLGAKGTQLTEDWLESATNLGFYEYLYGSPYNLPRTYVHKMAANYKYEQDHGAIAHFAELYPNFGEGPKAWIAAKLQWNADQDVDTLLQQWYERAVGADAAPYLEQYYDHWEQFWTDRVFQSAWYLDWRNKAKRSNYLNLYEHYYLKEITKEEIADSRSLLEQAVAHAGSDAQKTRAQLLLRAFEFYEASALSYPKDRPATPANEQAAMELLADIEKSYDMGQKRKQLITEFAGHPVLDMPAVSGTWDGVQRQMIVALQAYTANEPGNGPVRQALNEFLQGVPEYQGLTEHLSAYAVKTNAGKAAILQSLDFSSGPWTAAEPLTDFLTMETKATPSVQTKVYLLWDDENLYVGYENFFDDVNDLVISDDATGSWWSSGYDDSNETYITADPNSDFKGYFTNPKAVKFVYQYSQAAGAPAPANDPNWEANASLKSDRWNLVQVIPFASIGINDPKNSRNLQGFFMRNYMGATHYISWGGGNPWTPKDFNSVQLVESKNLIGNPSFEEGTGNIPAPWNDYVISPAVEKRSDVIAHSGRYSLLADGLWGGMGPYQNLQMAEPGKYRASFYYFMAGSAPTDGKIQWFSLVADGSGILETLKSEQVPLDWTKEMWNYFEFEYEIKEDYNGLVPTNQGLGISIWYMNPGEKVYIDDVSVYKIE